MAEYIERKAVIAKLNKAYDNMNALSPAFYGGYQNAVHRIKDFPAADVEPVRRGRWKLIGADKWGRGGEWKCMADGCGKLYPYKCSCCPNCGARMDGGAGNETTQETDPE